MAARGSVGGQLVGFDRPDRDVGSAAGHLAAVRPKQYPERGSIYRERPGLVVQVNIRVNYKTPRASAYEQRVYFNV